MYTVENASLTRGECQADLATPCTTVVASMTRVVSVGPVSILIYNCLLVRSTNDTSIPIPSGDRTFAEPKHCKI